MCGIDIFQSGRKQGLWKINLPQLLQAFYMKSFAKMHVAKYK